MNAARAVLIFAIATLLRFPALDRRPMHADEAVLAAKLDEPRYEPRDFHGPVLLYLTPARWADATEWNLRAVPAVAGSLLAAVPGAAPFYAGAFIALSPAMTWYSRDYIPEILLLLWTAWFVMARRWWLAGVAAGLMLATKETAVIALFAAALIWRDRFHWKQWLGAAAIAAILAAALLGPSGAAALATSYLGIWLPKAASAGPHQHGPLFYLELLFRTEWPILALAAVGAPLAPRLAIYSGIVLLIYSLIPYKTPWCALTALHGLALCAAFGVQRLGSRYGPAAAAIACLLLLIRNPEPVWSYAETSPDVLEMRRQIVDAVPRDEKIQVISTRNIWPLPWYLREFASVTYSRAIPDSLAHYIIATPDLEPDLIRAMYERPPPGQRFLYTPLFDRTLWLRNGLEVRAYRRL